MQWRLVEMSLVFRGGIAESAACLCADPEKRDTEPPKTEAVAWGLLSHLWRLELRRRSTTWRAGPRRRPAQRATHDAKMDAWRLARVLLLEICVCRVRSTLPSYT